MQMNKIQLEKEDIFRGNLVCINAIHPIVHKIDENEIVRCRKYGIDSNTRLPKLMRARVEGIISLICKNKEILIVSGYRSKEEQEMIWRQSIQKNGLDDTIKYVAQPGCSEHEAGLAVDLGYRKGKIDIVKSDFPDVEICNSFRNISLKHGFIERYPQQKENITNIGYEPWHFRFVGTPHSLIMNKYQMVLEEYLEYIKKYRYGVNALIYQEEGYVAEVTYIPYSGDTKIVEVNNMPFTISGNNYDGWILTVWERKH